jgi:alkaline phosphatase
MRRFNISQLLVPALLACGAGSALAAPTISRLTPPSGLFTYGDPLPPIISRFLPGQRFDLEATVQPDVGQTITRVEFRVNGRTVGVGADRAATVVGLAANTVCSNRRAYSQTAHGIFTLTAHVTQSDGQTTSASGNFEIVRMPAPVALPGQPKPVLKKAKNIIYLIGDGMGIAHRTAARIMKNGVGLGKSNAALAMDTMSNTALLTTHSLNSIITDSSPGAACYATGNKSNNNQQGVFPDDTTVAFDNPRVENIGEFLSRTQGKALGIVTTSDVFDATPGSFATHTANRGAGTGICDQFLDESAQTGLKVLMGGGRKWFLPNTVVGSARSASSDYVLPGDLASAWGITGGVSDPARDLLTAFSSQGFRYAANRTALNAIPATATKLLGLFAMSQMNVAKDKIDKRRGTTTIVDDYGFPDQPMLDEMTEKALQVLNNNQNGFVLMVEAASIDKQAHNMDTERWILDTIEFDYAVEKCLAFAKRNPDTLVIVTADHECAGVNIIGASSVTNADLAVRAASGGGAAQLRTGVVGVYEGAGFPVYTNLADGYPSSTDPDNKMLIGYAGNADRNEDWLTNAKPIIDTQQPTAIQTTLTTAGYPAGPLNRDTAGAFLITGQVDGTSAVHTGSDIPMSAAGRGANLFNGVMDNTDVFFRVMQAAIVGAP